MRMAIWIFSAGILIALALTICWISWRPNAIPLRIAIDPWPPEELLWLAKERGIFAEEGLDVQLVELNSAASSHTAFERGQVDLMTATCTELVLKNDRQLRVVLALDWSSGADVVLARPDLADVAALKGLRVAFEPGTLTSYHLMRALESAQLGWHDVTAVPIAQASMREAFLKGEIDALVTYPPFTGDLVASGRAHVVFDSSRIPHEIADLLMCDTAVLERIPDLPVRLRRVWARMLQTIDDDEAVAAMGRRERMSGDEFRATLTEGIRLVRPEEQVDMIASDGSLARTLPNVLRAMRLAGDPGIGSEINDRFLPRAALTHSR